MVSVLFVCLGNICRSPLAEGIFKQLIKEKGLEGYIKCDSAGTGSYHIGEQPDPRSVEVAQNHGIYLKHWGRQITSYDLKCFDYIIAMDESNYRNITRIHGFDNFDKSKLKKMMNFDGEQSGIDVPDPYYGGEDGFEKVYWMLDVACKNLLDYLVEEYKLSKYV